MTVIAFDGKTLAADKQASDNGLKRATTKIFILDNGDVAGFSGGFAQAMEMMAWAKNGYDPATFPAAQRSADDWVGFLVVDNHYVRVYGRSPYPMFFEDKCFAIGSGRDYAMAAMHLGQDAEQAVQTAIALDPNCGMGVDAIKVRK